MASAAGDDSPPAALLARGSPPPAQGRPGHVRGEEGARDHRSPLELLRCRKITEQGKGVYLPGLPIYRKTKK